MMEKEINCCVYKNREECVCCSLMLLVSSREGAVVQNRSMMSVSVPILINTKFLAPDMS